MLFKVKRMRQRGVPLHHNQLREAEELCVDVKIEHEGCVLGRASVVAKISTRWPLQTAPWPELLDVSLHSMAPNGMVLSGLEVVDGVAYAQSWLCRPPAR